MARRGFWIELAVLTALGVLLGLLGPFGTFDAPWPSRLTQWLLFVLGGALFFRPVIGASRVLARTGAMRLPAAILCACLLAAFPTTVLVAWCLAGTGWRRVTAMQLAVLYPEVLLAGGLATLLQCAIASRRNAGRTPLAPATPALDRIAPDPAPAPIGPGEPAPAAIVRGGSFLSRLPPALGRELICLENEDHYVRAHTSLGSTLILMRLGDAVAELDGLDGLRTHRSWWVARDAVDAVVRRDRLVALRLRNGIEAPVARTMVPVLRQAGWLSVGERVAPLPPTA